MLPTIPHVDQAVTRSPRERLWATVALLVLLAGLLMTGAAQRYLREDEAIAFAGTAGDLASTIVFQQRDVHAPLWFVSFHIWQYGFGIGNDELPSRHYSVLLSLLTLAVISRLGTRWFRNGWFGNLSLIALGTLAYFYLYGLEIRPYALVMLVAATSMWLFDRWLRRPTWSHALWYALSISAMLYLHYFGTFLVLAQVIYTLGYLIVHKPTAWRQIMIQGAALGAVAVLLWLPWAPTFLSQVRHVSQLLTPAESRAINGIGMASTTQPTDAASIERFITLVSNGLPLVWAAILLLGLLRLWRDARYWLVVAWGLGVPVSMFLINLLVPVYEPRYASTLVPGMGLLIGISAAAALQPLWQRGRLWFWLAVLAVAIYSAAMSSRAPIGIPNHLPARDFLRAMQALYQPDDGIIFDNNVIYELTGAYLYQKYAPSFLDTLRSETRANVPLATLETDNPMPRCVWFITDGWYTNPQTRVRFEAIAAKRPLQNVIGIDDRYLIQRLCRGPLPQPVIFGPMDGDRLQFEGAEIESRTEQAITLKLWWRVTQPVRLDYSISVRLLDPNGNELAALDGPIQDLYGRGLLQTTALQPNGYYIDRRTLRLNATLVPAQTWPSQVQVALKVYFWEGADKPLRPLPATGPTWLADPTVVVAQVLDLR